MRLDGNEAESALLAERLRPTRRLAALILLGWSVVVAASLTLSMLTTRDQVMELAAREARANFNKDQAFRLWATEHGGVYVPATEHTPPSPYLSHVTERDLVTPSGRTLTLMNPAYMVRQITEEYERLFGVKGHITSLKPHNPGNRPDDWERSALQAFETGTAEVVGLSDIDGKPYLRLMRPMMIQEGCLKCHAYQGYKVGDVRGGIGVAVSMDEYYHVQRRQFATVAFSHGGIWLLGVGGVLFARRRMGQRIADQVRDEIAIRTLHHRNQLLLDSVGEGICGVDHLGRVTFINRVALRLLGATEEQVLGKVLHDLIHHSHEDGSPYPAGECPVGRSFGDGQTHEVRGEVFWRLDGTCFPTDYLSTPVVENGQVCGAVLVFRDVTHQRAAEHGLMQKTEELQRSNADLEQFAYVASHDLREPLRMINSYLQLLKRRYGERLDKDADEFIAFAVDGAQRMDRLIIDLLAYSRVDRKGAPMEVVPAERAVTTALRVLKPRLDEAGAQVEIGPLPTVWVDEPQLVSVFQNLIGNALKYREPIRPLQIVISGERRDGWCEFTVADNGIGIESQYFERIFQIFQRLHAAQHYEGSGIGLALCKKIVERHRGRIWVESTPDAGSRFHFTLPVG
jgi:PAS domain S-box-containing protein